MAQKARKENKTYALKLGKSFDKGIPNVSYHTMRFDFKPVSLGTNKDLTMQIHGEKNTEVTATMAAPAKQGSGSSQNGQTVYKGSRKQFTPKECVLIIDEVTGEVTLEKLGDNIMLKKARPEGGNKNNPTAKAPQSDKTDASPFGTPSYSPAPSGSPTPSPTQPVAPVINTSKKVFEQAPSEKKLDKSINPNAKNMVSNKSAPVPPASFQKSSIVNKDESSRSNKDEESMDTLMESSSSDSSSESSSSESDEEMEPVTEGSSSSQKPADLSVRGNNNVVSNKSSEPVKSQSSSAPRAPYRSMQSLAADLAVSSSSESEEDDPLSF